MQRQRSQFFARGTHIQMLRTNQQLRQLIVSLQAIAEWRFVRVRQRSCNVVAGRERCGDTVRQPGLTRSKRQGHAPTSASPSYRQAGSRVRLAVDAPASAHTYTFSGHRGSCAGANLGHHAAHLRQRELRQASPHTVAIAPPRAYYVPFRRRWAPQQLATAGLGGRAPRLRELSRAA